MIRYKIKIISFITLLILSVFVPIVNAENETDTEQVIPISENQETTTIREGDQYLFQENVTVDTPVDGNLFIMANTVTINSQIGGDAFICANTINIEEDAYIFSNLFACSNTINMKGAVYNIYSIGNTLTIDGFVYRDVRSICNSLNINGMIGRNAFIDCSNIYFKENSDTEENTSITSYGTIQGNLTYFSDEKINIPENAVSGEISFSSLKTDNQNISTYMYSLGTVLVSAILIWLIGLWISPKLLLNTNNTMSIKKVLQIIGLGILVPIILSLLSIIILLIPITTQFTILLLCLLVILFFISTSVTIININTMICNKLKITQNLYILGFLIITAVIFWLLTLIPYVGTILSLIAIIWGIGNISYKLFINETINKSERTETNAETNPETNNENHKSDENKNK